ncbi:MAG: AAA family ATPase [Clostridia bacterium]|nr:AAA family ATPase [Clostridia bacterium]
MDIRLSDEQQNFIDLALSGKNILVNACIGSGKTTAIQCLTQVIPSNKSILYLTYNRLLKVDAKSKIMRKNTMVTNYHGFASTILKPYGIPSGIPDLIQTFLKTQPYLPHYDILLIDEYQDIDQELSEMLEVIKESNPYMQLIAVGDMDQKIYDKTSLDIRSFINSFLGQYETLSFTKCFRLNAEHAAMLGEIWHKPIVGVNDTAKVEVMTCEEAVQFLSKQQPSDILCLGGRKGTIFNNVLNRLEMEHPSIFNKKTVWASISNKDGMGSTEPNQNSAIFTTFDSSKGLERKICVVADFTDDYWRKRADQPFQKYEILRNIFCVAASRGKEHIIFISPSIDTVHLLSKEVLAIKFDKKDANKLPIPITELFDFKYIESIEKCYSLLEIKDVSSDDLSEIPIKTSDCLIDLSPCVGIYQESSFFQGYDLKTAILFYDPRISEEEIDQASEEEKVLILTALETKQDRYRVQVEIPFIAEEETKALHRRLETVFSRNETIQKLVQLDFAPYGFPFLKARGYCDVIKDNIVYELKFVSELTHTHFLQCACYMIGLGLKKGILWNTRFNKKFEIRIKDQDLFMLNVAETVLKKDHLTASFEGKRSSLTLPQTTVSASPFKLHVSNAFSHHFAVLDVETTLAGNVMSVGLVIADKHSFNQVDQLYLVSEPECTENSMFRSALWLPNTPRAIMTNKQALGEHISRLLNQYGVHEICAYNAGFDQRALPCLNNFFWIDIMKIAPYKQFNSKIPDSAECCSTGRLKTKYKAQDMIHLLTGNLAYSESHNAFRDAQDELLIMQKLNLPFEIYVQHGSLGLKSSSPSFGSSKSVLYNKTENPIIRQNQPKPFVSQSQFSGFASDKPIAQTVTASSFSPDLYYGFDETAHLLGQRRTDIHRYIDEGKLQAIQKWNRIYITKESANKLKDELDQMNEEAMKIYRIIFGMIFLMILLFCFLSGC